MKKEKYIKATLTLIILSGVFFTGAQPFVDIVSFNSQHFTSQQKETDKGIYSQDHFLNFFLPKKIGNRHLLIVRLNSESLTLKSGSDQGSLRLYSIATPVGIQRTSKNQSWKYTIIFIPRVSSDFTDNLQRDYQFGGIGMVTKQVNENLQLKLGLYYNREFFGNFFIPLAGIDYKINNRFRIYGTLPSMYRFECLLPAGFSTGIGFRAYQRSYRLGNMYQNDYVRIKENQLKIYVEKYFFKSLVLTLEAYRSLGYKITTYKDGTKTENTENRLTPAFTDNFGFNFGIAFRVPTTAKVPGPAR